MKKRNKLIPVINGLMAVLYLALFIFIIVKYCYVVSEQNRIEQRLSVIEEKLSDISEGPANTDGNIPELTDAVSVSLGIISAGISVFAIFGGLIGVLNIKRSKELEDAINSAQEVQQAQCELKGARYIQDGRVYEARARKKYAKDCFEYAMECAPKSNIALIAESEIILLYADSSPLSEASFKIIQTKYDNLMQNLKSNLDFERRLLRADICFVLACVYGDYSLRKPLQKEEYLERSDACFLEASKYDSSNVNIYRNYAITNALAGDCKKLRDNLMLAFYFAKQEPLYTELVDTERLRKMFSPYWDIFPSEIKRILENALNTSQPDDQMSSDHT